MRAYSKRGRESPSHASLLQARERESESCEPTPSERERVRVMRAYSKRERERVRVMRAYSKRERESPSHASLMLRDMAHPHEPDVGAAGCHAGQDSDEVHDGAAPAGGCMACCLGSRCSCSALHARTGGQLIICMCIYIYIYIYIYIILKWFDNNLMLWYWAIVRFVLDDHNINQLTR